MVPSIAMVSRHRRMLSTAAWSAVCGSPMPMVRAEAIAASSTTRKTSRDRSNMLQFSPHGRYHSRDGWHLPMGGEYTQAMKRILLLLSLGFTARAQNTSPDPQTLQALLTEVHQLRLALERSSQIAPRIQIAVERLKLQQDQVARTGRELEELRRDMDARRSDLPK